MDYTFLSSCTISTSGPIPEELFLHFVAHNVRVVTWSSNIAALVCAADTSVAGTGPGGATDSWKAREARRFQIPIVDADALLGTWKSTATPNELWVDKYKPRSLNDVIGHAEQIKQLMTWLQCHGKDKSLPRGALVTGPPGIGKTTTVHLVATACGYDVVELNASDERSATAVRKWFEEAAHAGHVGTRRVVVMDEVDGMSSGDRGGIGEIAKIIKTCVFPIICIANERSTPRLRPLVSACYDVRFARPFRSTIARALCAIAKKESLSFTSAQLEDLCERNGNDIRQILNFLQFQSSARLRPCGAAGAKDELLRVDAFSATGRLFGRGGSLDERSNLVYVDYGIVPLMVAEGYIAAAAKSDAPLENAAAAAEHLGSYDILDRRIHRTQQWGLLPSAVTQVVGAARAAMGPAPFQIFPSLLGKMSKRNKHRRLLGELGAHGGWGRDAMMDAQDTLRARLFRGGAGGAQDASQVVDTLVSLGLTRDDMLETLTETAFDEKSVAIDTKLKGAITREWKKRDIPVSEKVAEGLIDSDSDDEAFAPGSIDEL